MRGSEKALPSETALNRHRAAGKCLVFQGNDTEIVLKRGKPLVKEVLKRGSAVVVVVARVPDSTLRRPAAIELEGVDYLSATFYFDETENQTLHLAIFVRDTLVRAAYVPAFVPHEDVLRLFSLPA